MRITDRNGWYANYYIGETVGVTNILIDKSADLIVGAHLFGRQYSERRRQQKPSTSP